MSEKLAEPRYVKRQQVPGELTEREMKVRRVAEMLLDKKDTWVEVPASYLQPRDIYEFAKTEEFEGYVQMRNVGAVTNKESESFYVKWASKKRASPNRGKNKENIPEPVVVDDDGEVVNA